jgi:hypothetical protein
VYRIKASPGTAGFILRILNILVEKDLIDFLISKRFRAIVNQNGHWNG